MNKILKGSLLSLALIFVVSPVKAAENCTTYKNYYFFDEINGRTYTINKITNSENASWPRIHETYYPKLDDGVEPTRQGKVCLSKGDKKDGTECIETWTLEDFYGKNKQIFSMEEKELTTPKGKSAYKVLEDNDNNTKYFFHYKWYEIEGENVEEKSDVVDYSTKSSSELIEGAFFPTSTTITPDFSDASSIMMRVERLVEENNLENVTGFDLDWGPEYGGIAKTVLTPTLYLIEYEVCPEDVKYKAVIDYFYAGTEDRIIIKDKEVPAYTENNLEDGYENEVLSPKLEGCTPDMEKVNIKIEGKDFYQPVYYTCKIDEEIDDPGKTGSALIYIAWAVGAGALGYSVYYLLKNKPKKVK